MEEIIKQLKDLAYILASGDFISQRSIEIYIKLDSSEYDIIQDKLQIYFNGLKFLINKDIDIPTNNEFYKVQFPEGFIVQFEKK